MDNININNIFSSSKLVSDRPLDVYSLYHPNDKKEQKKIKFSIDGLLNVREERKKKAIEQYKKIFHMCLKKIKDANKMNNTDLMYEVPIGIFRLPEYNSVECLNYIDERLQRLYMDTLIVSENSIYITWINIEENRNKNLEQTKKKD